MKPFGALVQPNSKVDLYSQHSFKVDTQGLGHQFTLWLNVMEWNDGQLKLAISWKVLPMLLSVQKNKKKNPTWLGCLFPKWQFNLTGWSHLKAGFGGRYADSRQSVSLITSGRPEGAQCFRTQFCFNDLMGRSNGVKGSKGMNLMQVFIHIHTRCIVFGRPLDFFSHILP